MSAGVAQRVVTAAIVANFPIAVWSEITHDELAERLDGMLLGLFAIEISVRLVLALKRKSWDRWLAIDATIVALAALPIGLPFVLRGARLAHLARHGMHLRHATIARAANI